MAGFVRLFGENGQDRTDPKAFAAQPDSQTGGGIGRWRRHEPRFSIRCIFRRVQRWSACSAMARLPVPIRNPRLSVADVSSSAAQQAGIKQGDAILRCDGHQPATIDDLHAATVTPHATLFVVERKHEQIHVTITPTPSEDGTARFGLQVVPIGVISYPLHQAIGQGALLTVRAVGQIITSLGDFFGNLVVHQKIAQDVSGPVGIAVLTGQVVALGWPYLFQFVALLSLSLAIMNVLPIPALDGGRLAFLLIERFRRKPIDQRTEQTIHAIGFYVLLALIVAISIRDVQRFAIVDSLRSAWRTLFS